MEAEDLEQLCIQALWKAHDILNELGTKGAQTVPSSKDIVTRGDIAISEGVTKLFTQHNAPIVLFTEEFGRKELAADPQYMVTFDDIDGTKNYEMGKNVLPYCSVIALFDGNGDQATFKDIIFAAILEHRSKELWTASRNKGTYLNGVRVSTDQTKKLHKKSRVAVDSYAFQDEIAQPYLAKISELKKLFWVVDFGVASLHFAGLSSGMFDGYVTLAQKAHELSAGYLIVTEAGGFISDITGKPLTEQRYYFNAVYQVIGATNRPIREQLLQLLK